MKAYNVKYGADVVVTDDKIIVPPDSSPVFKGDIITIYKDDGMYCSARSSDGELIYIFSNTEVELI